MTTINVDKGANEDGTIDKIKNPVKIKNVKVDDIIEAGTLKIQKLCRLGLTEPCKLNKIQIGDVITFYVKKLGEDRIIELGQKPIKNGYKVFLKEECGYLDLNEGDIITVYMKKN